jgi:hypothetical protein
MMLTICEAVSGYVCEGPVKVTAGRGTEVDGIPRILIELEPVDQDHLFLSIVEGLGAALVEGLPVTEGACHPGEVEPPVGKWLI